MAEVEIGISPPSISGSLSSRAAPYTLKVFFGTFLSKEALRRHLLLLSSLQQRLLVYWIEYPFGI